MIEAAIILFSIVGCIIFIYFISDLSPPGKLTRVTTSRHGTLYLLHPSLMSFGILVLMSSAIIAYRGELFGMDRKYNRIVHVILQSLAFSCVFASICCAVAFKQDQINHNAQMFDHFRSGHSWLGLISFSLICLNVITGTLKYLKLPVKSLRWHNEVGILAYLFGISAMVMGMQQSMQTDFFGTAWWLGPIVGTLPVLIGMATTQI